MQRRTFLAVSALSLAAPSLVRGQSQTTLKFIPVLDLAFLDPHWTTALVTRNHGYMVFDTLYGQNGSFTASPQMVAGHTTENDGKLWKLTLREGLLWHDGTPVLARDCVASINAGPGGMLWRSTDTGNGRPFSARRPHHPVPSQPPLRAAAGCAQ